MYLSHNMNMKKFSPTDNENTVREFKLKGIRFYGYSGRWELNIAGCFEFILNDHIHKKSNLEKGACFFFISKDDTQKINYFPTVASLFLLLNLDIILETDVLESYIENNRLMIKIDSIIFKNNYNNNIFYDRIVVQ